MKTVKVLVAALAAIAIATPAMAVTADISGNLWVRGIMTDGVAANDQEARGFDQRLRLFTTAAANENVKMVLGLEVDNIWGSATAPAAPIKGQVGAMGADATGQIEIKHLYLDFKVPTVGATVRAGTQYFKFGRGMIMNDDAAGLQFSMPVAGNSLDLTYIRTQTGSHATGDDNGNFYGAKYSLAFGDMKIAPYLGYYKEEDGAPTPREVIYVGADVDGKAGNFGYAATAIFNDWEAGPADGNGMALFGKVTTKVEKVGLSFEVGYMGDSDAGEFVDLGQSGTTGPVVNISEITTGGRFTQNSSLNANIGGAANLYKSNWLFAKIGASMQLTDASKVSAFIAHVQEAEDRSATLKARTYGQEIDLYYDYAIVPNLDLTLLGAYLIADDELQADNAYKLGTMLAYKF